MSQALTRQDQLKPFLVGAQKQITSLLQDDAKAKKFLAASLVVASDKSLNQCSPDSIVQALVGIAMSDLNVDKNIGHAYLVPYGGACQLQIGYRGYIQLLHRAGWAVKAFPVYQCDRFEMAFDGWDNKIVFVPAIDDRDEGDKDWVINNLRGVYVVARHADTKDEYSTFVSKAVIEKLRRTSPMQKSDKPVGTWKDWYSEMAMAKAIKKLAKILPIGDGRVHMAVAADDKSEIGAKIDYQKTASEGVLIEGEQVSQAQPTRRGRSIDDVIGNEPETQEQPPIEGETVNVETGEILPPADEYADLRIAISECQTMADIARLLNEMPAKAKAALKPELTVRQNEIKVHANG
jgi:phage RecT family recombinase